MHWIVSKVSIEDFKYVRGDPARTEMAIEVNHQGPSGTREKLLGAKEVATWLGVSRAWVFEHSNGRRRPLLPSVKLGKSVRYRPMDVDAFILECERFSRKGAA